MAGAAMSDTTGRGDRSAPEGEDSAVAGPRPPASQPLVALVLAAVAATVPATLLVAATAFDVESQRAQDQYVFARAGFLLSLAGVLTGVVATMVVVWALSRLDRGTAAFRQGRAALLVIDLALAWFGIACFRRLHYTLGAVPVWTLGPSALALAGLVVAVGILVRIAAAWPDE